MKAVADGPLVVVSTDDGEIQKVAIPGVGQWVELVHTPQLIARVEGRQAASHYGLPAPLLRTVDRLFVRFHPIGDPGRFSWRDLIVRRRSPHRWEVNGLYSIYSESDYWEIVDPQRDLYHRTATLTEALETCLAWQ